jgi:hypothetical protein
MTVRDLFLKGLRNPNEVPIYVIRQAKHKLLDLCYDYDSEQMNIYERDWDLLIILDACRVDTIQEISDEYHFLPDSIPSITSVAGDSPKWLANTFNEEWISDINRTGYISANPHTRRVLGDTMDGLFTEVGGPEDRLSDFEYFAPIWETDWDEELETVPARAVTDHLIQFYRSQPSKRTIAHYMQPHFPSVPSPIGEGMDIENQAHWNSNDVWTLIKNGEIAVDEAYDSYVQNLRYVLDDIQLVLSNIDAENVIITADHGNAFGEWGEYGHGFSGIGSIRNVPWIETSARDKNEYQPESKEILDDESPSVEEKLRALGYKA